MPCTDPGCCDANKRKGRWNLRNLVRDRLNHSPENWRDLGWGVEFIEVDCSDEGSLT